MPFSEIPFFFRCCTPDCLCPCSALLTVSVSFAQSPVSLDDLSAFQKPSKNWQVVGSVTADLEQKNQLTTQPGTGVLVNLMDRIKKPQEFIHHPGARRRGTWS